MNAAPSRRPIIPVGVPLPHRYQSFEERGDPFSGAVVVAQMGAVRVCHITAKAHDGASARRHITGKDTPFHKVIFQMKGRVQLLQGERRTVFAPGDWSIYDVSRPYSMLNLEPLEQLAVLLPRDLKCPQLERELRRLPEAPLPLLGMARVLFEAARSALYEAGELNAATREALGDGLLEIGKLALLERFGARERVTVRETFRERVERHVLRNLADPELSIESIATALDCSKRYLHKVFAESGNTLSNHIWSLRLERCRRDLVEPSLAGRSITEIAFNWGFVNSAHFSRAFARRFDQCPRDYRRDGASDRIFYLQN